MPKTDEETEIEGVEGWSPVGTSSLSFHWTADSIFSSNHLVLSYLTIIQLWLWYMFLRGIFNGNNSLLSIVVTRWSIIRVLCIDIDWNILDDWWCLHTLAHIGGVDKEAAAAGDSMDDAMDDPEMKAAAIKAFYEQREKEKKGLWKSKGQTIKIWYTPLWSKYIYR